MDPALIRLSGRWASDVYEIYCRLSKQAAARLSSTIGSTAFDDLESGEFVDEEFAFTRDAASRVATATGSLPVASDGDSSDDES